MSRFGRYMEDLSPSRKDAKPPAPSAGNAVNLPRGQWIADGVFLTKERFALGARYGRGLLERPEDARAMQALGAKEPLVFLDLETTGLSGGTGAYAFLCGIGKADGQCMEVSQFFLEGPAREKNWLEAVDAIIPPGACLVTYNGRSFDLPLLKTRHTMARRTPHWENTPHIDLLLHTRKLYRGRLESCSLGSLERHVLRVGRDADDIPGWQIPALYADYLRTRDAKKLHGVFGHNSQDILSLAALYCHVGHILGGETDDGCDLIRAGDVWENIGYHDLALGFWERACGHAASCAAARTRLAHHAKKQKLYAQAHAEFILALAAANKSPGEWRETYTLLEEIAKLEEHRLKMPQKALGRTEEAAHWLRSHRALLGNRYDELERELRVRAERLRRKIGKKRRTENTCPPTSDWL